MKIGFEAKRVFHNKTGLGNYSRDLIRILNMYYPQNTYNLYNPKSSTQNLFLFTSNNVVEKLPQSPFCKRFYNIWRQRGIVTDLVKDNIEIYHGLSGELPIGISKKNIKTVVTIHDLIFLRYPQFYAYIDTQIHHLKFKHAAEKADVVIAISEQTKKDIVHFLDIPASKIKVVYQSCHQAFKNEYTVDEKKVVLQKYNLPESYILNVGTIEERKNILSVIQAIRKIDTHLVIVGKQTKYSQTILEYITKHNMQSKVVFLEGLSVIELAILYQEATIFVYPSLFEGFGIPIIEALYSKTPVITSFDGCFSEAGGPNSLYVIPTDYREIRFQIKRLLEDHNLRKTITTRGFEYVQRFNNEVIASDIHRIYESLISENK